MRVFYIFDIREEIRSLYFDHPRDLYQMLRQLYYLESDNIDYGFNLFSQLTNRIEKQKLDNFLFLKLHQEIPYSKRENIHYFNNLYKNEISNLTVRSSYIKIKSEQNLSSFFQVLSNYYPNFFVCDFKMQDYFWLNVFSYQN